MALKSSSYSAWDAGPEDFGGLTNRNAKLQLKDNKYPCHSERSAAQLRISAAKKERFFAPLRMTNISRLTALG
jgi:hypothetical protein